MTLRNAFAEMLTERTGRLILAAVQYARTASDQMRVVVDSGSVTMSGGPYMHGSSTAATYQVWNAPAATYTVDQRETARQQSQMLAELRRQKWRYV